MIVHNTDGRKYSVKMRAAYEETITTEKKLDAVIDGYFSKLPTCPNGKPAGWSMTKLQKLEYMGIIKDARQIK